ncbi:winged helix DNA-binding domain-containing protein, partial [Laetiporus sulphureus 93-53]
RIVDDPSTDELIGWGKDGRSFYVSDDERFAQEILQPWIGHHIFKNFVKQLDMYDIRGTSQPPQGDIKDSRSQSWIFTHKSFLRGHPGLLPLVKRRTL